MFAADFFRHRVVQLPLKRGGGEDFDDFLRRVLEEYVQLVSRLGPLDQVTQEIKDNCSLIGEVADDLNETVGRFLVARPTEASQTLFQAVSKLKPYTTGLYTQDISGHLHNLYRLRVEDGSPPTSRGEMFHIPFNLRHLVGPQRYSMTGIPCLYLGGSLYLCWEELRRPAFDRVYVSRFSLESGEQVNLLDFGFRPLHIASLWEHALNSRSPILEQQRKILAASYGICWPLIAACSIAVRDQRGSFRPEYIIPQLVLQWVTESPDHDGVRYSSVNINWHCENSLALSNFVFPVKSNAKAGVCPRLRTKFKLTEPVAWQVAETVYVPGNLPGNFEVEIIKGFRDMYLHTKFFEMEVRLSKLPHSLI